MLKMMKDKVENDFVHNFYIVNSTFSLPPLFDGRMIEDTEYCYGASITRVHINKNCIDLAAHSDVKDTVASDNLHYVKSSLQKSLMKNGIEIKGSILYDNKIPKDASKIVEINGDFYEIASYAMKTSDDFIADYSLAAFTNRFHAKTWSDAGLLLKKYIFEEFAIELNQSVMVDASGLSRFNLFTPSQFDSFLRRIHSDRQFEMFKAMLARPSEIGTMKNRLKGVNIFAKTGTMTGVSSLVGYVYDSQKTLYSFAIVSNNYVGKKHKYAELEDKIIKILLV